MADRWHREDFALPSQELAPLLLGHTLVHRTASGQRVGGTIVEVEAYMGVKDRAAHSFGGRRTPRTECMYHAPGTAYVYLTYGMHHCFNVVCGDVDEPVAVLVRAVDPGDGVALMRRRRLAGTKGRKTPLEETALCAGPGRLCQALGLDRRHNGIDMDDSTSLFIERGSCVPRPSELERGPRIGIGDCGVWTRRRLRWWVSKNPHVSR